MLKWIITAILLLPFAEFATFVVVALLIGWGWAFLLALATSIAGFLVLKQAGRGRLANFGAAVARNDISGIEAQAGSFLAILGGILLLLPGFLTDLAGALLLIPYVRRLCTSRLRPIAPSGTPGRTVVDLERDEWQQLPDHDMPREPDRRDPH